AISRSSEYMLIPPPTLRLPMASTSCLEPALTSGASFCGTGSLGFFAVLLSVLSLSWVLSVAAGFAAVVSGGGGGAVLGTGATAARGARGAASTQIASRWLRDEK